MKTRIRITTIYFLLTLIIMTANAQRQNRNQQTPPPPLNEKQIEQMIGKLETKLSISKEQKEKLTNLMKEHFSDIKKVHEKYKKSHQAERSEIETLQNKMNDSLNSVLSEDQILIFKEFMKENMPKDKGYRKRPKSNQVNTEKIKR